ncbi:MAG TPA: hypothetical protein VF881_09100 [Polyangiaceae bacterium]
MMVTLYRLPDGRFSFVPVEGVEEVAAELADGYRLDGSSYSGQTMVFGKPGKHGMTADEAVAKGAIRLVETK